MLRERLGKPVYLENDANCAAYGEAKAGAGAGVKDFIAITLGTGVGSGIIVDGISSTVRTLPRAKWAIW